MPTTQPFTYQQVRDIYETVGSSPFFEGLTLPQFASRANWATGTQDYSQGLSDNWIKQASSWIDKQLVPFSQRTALAGEAVGGLFGPKYAEWGKEYGADIPRMGLNLAPMMLAPKYVGIPASAALAGAQSYTETGSPLAGLISGTAVAAMPTAASWGERGFTELLKPLMYRQIGRPIVGQATGEVAKIPGAAAGMAETLLEGRWPKGVMSALSHGAEVAGANVGAAVDMELATQAQAFALTGSYQPWDEKHLVMSIASQIPFMGLDLIRFARGAVPVTDPITGRTEYAATQSQARLLERGLKNEALVTAYNETLKPLQTAMPPGMKLPLEDRYAYESGEWVSTSRPRVYYSAEEAAKITEEVLKAGKRAAETAVKTETRQRANALVDSKKVLTKEDADSIGVDEINRLLQSAAIAKVGDTYVVQKNVVDTQQLILEALTAKQPPKVVLTESEVKAAYNAMTPELRAKVLPTVEPKLLVDYDQLTAADQQHVVDAVIANATAERLQGMVTMGPSGQRYSVGQYVDPATGETVYTPIPLGKVEPGEAKLPPSGAEELPLFVEKTFYVGPKGEVSTDYPGLGPGMPTTTVAKDYVPPPRTTREQFLAAKAEREGGVAPPMVDREKLVTPPTPSEIEVGSLENLKEQYLQSIVAKAGRSLELAKARAGEATTEKEKFTVGEEAAAAAAARFGRMTNAIGNQADKILRATEVTRAVYELVAEALGKDNPIAWRLLKKREESAKRIEPLLKGLAPEEAMARLYAVVMRELGDAVRLAQTRLEFTYQSILEKLYTFTPQKAVVAEAARQQGIEAAQKAVLAGTATERQARLTEEAGTEPTAVIRKGVAKEPEPVVEALKKVLTASKVEDGLTELEKQPWGRSAFRAFLSFEQSGVQYAGLRTDMGVTPPLVFFQMLRRLAELAKPEVWNKAYENWVGARPKAEAEAVSKAEVEQSVARHYIAGHLARRTPPEELSFWEYLRSLEDFNKVVDDSMAEEAGGVAMSENIRDVEDVKGLEQQQELALLGILEPDLPQRRAAMLDFVQNLPETMTLEEWNKDHMIPAGESERFTAKSQMQGNVNWTGGRGSVTLQRMNLLLRMLRENRLVMSPTQTRDYILHRPTVEEMGNILAELGYLVRRPADTPEKVKATLSQWQNFNQLLFRKEFVPRIKAKARAVEEQIQGMPRLGGIPSEAKPFITQYTGAKGRIVDHSLLRQSLVLALDGVNQVVEPFYGTGAVSQLVRAIGGNIHTVGFEKNPVLLKIYAAAKDPTFVERVDAALKELDITRHATKTKGGVPLKEWLTQLEQVDEGVALVLAQNLSHMGRPLSSIAEGTYQVRSLEALTNLPARLRTYQGEDVNVYNADGWTTLSQTPPESLVIVDPPYVGRGRFGNQDVSTQQRLSEYNRYIAPRVNADPKTQMIVFDARQPGNRTLEARLQSLGFSVFPFSEREFVAISPEITGRVMDWLDVQAGRLTVPPAKYQKLQFAAGAKVFFQDHFERTGFTPSEAASYAGVLQRVALAFEGIGWGKIVGMTEKVGLGGFFKENIAGEYLIGINPQDIVGQVSRPLMLWVAAKTLAHELVHGITSPWVAGRLPKHLEQLSAQLREAARSLEPDLRREALETLFEVAVPQPLRLHHKEFYQKALNNAATKPNEFLAEVGSLYALGMASPDPTARSRVLQHNLFSAASLQQLTKSLFVPLHEISDALEAYWAWHRPELVPVAKGWKDGFSALVHGSEKIDELVTQLRTIESFERENYVNLVGGGYVPITVPMSWISPRYKGSPAFGKAFDRAAKELGLVGQAEHEKLWGAQPNWFWRNIAPSAQLSDRFPQLRPVFDIVRSFYPMAEDAVNKILRPFLVKRSFGRQVLDLELTGLKHLLDTPTASFAASKIALLQQVEKRAYSDAEMRTLMRNESQKTQDSVIAFHTAARQIMPELHNQVFLFMRDTMDMLGAKELLGRNRTMPWQQAEVEGKNLGKLVWDHFSQDPAVAAAADTVLAQKQTAGVPGEAQAIGTMMSFADKVKKWNDRTQNQDWFFSELRFGKFMLGWTVKGKPNEAGVVAKDTQTEIDAYAEVLKRKYGEANLNMRPWSKYDRTQAMSGMNVDIAETWREVEAAAFRYDIQNLGLDQDTVRLVLGGHEPGMKVFHDMAMHGVERYFMERKLRPGREEINMVQGLLRYVRGTSIALAKRKVTDRIILAMSDPELRANPELLKLARKQFTNVVNPPAGELGFLKRLMFTHFMGLNFSSSLIELTQGSLVLAPQLTRDSGNLAVGYKYLMRAAQYIPRLSLYGRAKGTGEPELDRVIQRARDEQRIDFGTMQELSDLASLGMTNVRSVARGGPITSTLSYGKNAIDWYTHWARNIYSITPRINTNLAFISAYKMAREHGVLREGTLRRLNEEDAYSYAVGVIDKTMYSGGVAARPVGAFANLGKVHGVAGAMYCLGSYTLSTLTVYARLAADSIAKARLPASERAAARKALGQMVLTQVAIGGAMSLPFMTAAMAVLEELFPELEVRRNADEAVRAAFTAMMGGDDDKGNLMADMALRGLPHPVGVDISQRVALSQILGVDPYNGFKFSNFFGPTGNMIENYYKGIQEMSVGRIGEGTERVLPVAWKNLLQLYRDKGQITDQSGRPIVQDTTPLEMGLYAIGLRPTRLTKAREAARMAARADEVWNSKNRVFHEQMAQRMIAGDLAAVQQALMQRELDHPNLYSAVAGARAVVDEVMDRTLPYDFTRDGPRLAAPTRQALATQLGVRQVGETERVQTKMRLEQALGVPGAGSVSRTAVSRAMLVDQLRGMNPLLSWAEASAMADQLLMRGAPRMLAPAQSATGLPLPPGGRW